MQNLVKRLKRNLSTRQIIINVISSEYIIVTVIQHEQGKKSVVMIDDKKYSNTGFKGGVISSYTHAVKDLTEVLYDISQNDRVQQYSTDFMGKVYVDFIIPDKYNYSYFQAHKIVLDDEKITSALLDDVKDDMLKKVLSLHAEKVVLYNVVCNWELDGNNTMSPVDLRGKELKCYMHYILVDQMIQKNFENLLLEKGLVLNSIFPRVCLDVATYTSSFSERTMLLCIDQDVTTFTTVIDGDIVFCAKINIGFQHIINDVVSVLNISVKQAIDYIAEYGLVYDKDHVKVDKDKALDKELLYNVILSRVYELMNKIKTEYIGNMMNVDRICLLHTKILGIEKCVEKIFDGIEVLPLELERYNQRLLLNSMDESKKSSMVSKFLNYIF